MGVVISTLIGTVALFACGVLSSIAADKARKKEHKSAETYSIITAIIAFLAAIVSMVIAIVLL